MPAKRFFVEGKVQGVFFRASARTEAERLGIAGHALNLPDGRVEVLAVGDASALAELEAWLQHGPPRARVDSVIVQAAGELELAGVQGFRCG